jgi:hypothetical protein
LLVFSNQAYDWLLRSGASIFVPNREKIEWSSPKIVSVKAFLHVIRADGDSGGTWTSFHVKKKWQLQVLCLITQNIYLLYLSNFMLVL